MPGEMPRKRESEEAVFDGKACSLCPRGYPQLAVDGDEVPLDGAGANEESLGNLRVGHSGSHQSEYLNLSRCEPGWLLGRSGGWDSGGGFLFREGILDC